MEGRLPHYLDLTQLSIMALFGIIMLIGKAILWLSALRYIDAANYGFAFLGVGICGMLPLAIWVIYKTNLFQSIYFDKD
jgi:hypothetical protein